MSTIVTRSGKGSPLTNTEVDANFTNLNTDKAELSGATFTGAVTANAGVVVDNITIDGSEIDCSSGNLVLDGASNITFDADGGQIEFKDAGALKALIDFAGNNVEIQSRVSDGDLLFRGLDGSSFITALSLDMSEGGSASFAKDILLGDNAAARFGTGQDLAIFHDGSNSTIRNTTGNLTLDVAGDIILDADGADVILKDGGTSFLEIDKDGDNARLKNPIADGDIKIQGIDGASTITALSLDMSAAGAATFNSSVTLKNTLSIGSTSGAGRTMVFADISGSPAKRNWVMGAQYNTNDGWELTPSTAAGGSTFTNRVLTAYGTTGNLVVNENGIDADFRVESSGNDHMLFVHGGDNRVGIGTSSPSAPLQVSAAPSNTVGAVGISLKDSGNAIEFGLRLDATSKDLHLDRYYNGGWLETMSWDRSTGNVGIGTSNPTVGKLHINDSGGAILALTRTSGVASDDLGVIRFGNTDIDSNLANIRGLQNGSTTSSALTFETQSTGGATAERMRIDSSGNVGIGVSPSAKLHLKASNNAYSGGFRIEGTDETTALAMTHVNGDNFFSGNGTDDHLVLTGTGNVGIGVVPSAWAASSNALQVGVYAGLSRNDALGAGDLSYNAYLTTSASDSWSRIIANASTRIHQRDGSIQFKYGASGAAGGAITWSEAMRIDASANLLVGTTSAYGTTGTTINAAGLVYSSADGDRAGQFDRTTSDGELVRFSKAGTTVGSIGTQAGDLTVGNADVALRFADNIDSIIPFSQTANADRGGAIDLGYPSAATTFKDAYLSGGIYLGGTGAANKLDDYEEGTFTPTLFFGGVISSGATYGNAVGTYTKIGNRVTYSLYLLISNKGTTTGQFMVGGFPFNAHNGGGAYNVACPAIMNLISHTGQISCYQEADLVRFYSTATTGVRSTMNQANVSNNSEIMLSGTYKTTE